MVNPLNKIRNLLTEKRRREILPAIIYSSDAELTMGQWVMGQKGQ